MIESKRDFAAELSENLIITIDQFVPFCITSTMVDLVDQGVWSPSRVQSLTAATRQASVTTGRKSSTLVAEDLGQWMTEQVRKIERSLKQLLGVEPLNLEPWQVTRYRRGQAFDYHLDCGCWRDHPSGERKRTILLYLQQPVRGGATHFRALNMKILPIVGRLAAWNNLLLNGNCNHAMIHSGRPVWQGRKTILTTWEHEARYVRDDAEEVL